LTHHLELNSEAETKITLPRLQQPFCFYQVSLTNCFMFKKNSAFLRNSAILEQRGDSEHLLFCLSQVFSWLE